MNELPTSDAHILDHMEINISVADLNIHLGTTANREKILTVAEDLLLKSQGIWHPRAIFLWFGVKQAAKGEVCLVSQGNEEGLRLQLGYSGIFMDVAERALVGVYTAGGELVREAAEASREKRYMDAFLYDLMGLAVLEKTRLQINRVVEEEAAKSGWGVGPFLSPGSVHGWDLGDQWKLCTLVPLDRINVYISKQGILQPFTTITCLIGIGPRYQSTTVGSTCQVCSKSQNCEMKKT